MSYKGLSFFIDGSIANMKLNVKPHGEYFHNQYVLKGYVGSIWILVLNMHLCLIGVWLGVDLNRHQNTFVEKKKP